MATKLNTNVIGGFSKLIKHIPYVDIISYIDRSKFTGKSYFATGWNFLSYTQPSYAYYKDDIKLNRMAAQKHKLSKLLGEENFDANLTEYENMKNNYWAQLYDCGNIKVKFSKNKIQ